MMEGLRTNPRLEVIRGAKGKFLAMIRTAVSLRPDVIHVDWVHSYFSRRSAILTWLHAPLFVLEVLLVRWLFGVRFVWTMHNLGTHDKPFSAIERWTRKRFAQICDGVRVFHMSTVERASRIFGIPPEKFFAIPEGSYAGYYPDDISREEARGKLDLRSDSFVLLYLGNVRPYKGLENLISEFKRLAEPNWVLMIAGDATNADYAEKISRLCSGCDRLRLVLRFVSDNDLQYYFNSCDAVVLPFLSIENSGSVVLAMTFGCPVVAPRKGVIPERLSQQRELVYESGHLGRVLERLKSMSTEELSLIGHANRAEVERYEWKAFGDAHIWPVSSVDTEQQNRMSEARRSRSVSPTRAEEDGNGKGRSARPEDYVSTREEAGRPSASIED